MLENQGNPQNKLRTSANSINYERAISSFNMDKDDPASKRAKKRRNTLLQMKQNLIINSAQVATTAELKKLELEGDAGGPVKKVIVVEGKSLGCLGPDTKLRQLCHRIVSYRHYDNIILGLILFSTILLTFDNPLEYEKSRKKIVLKYFDYVLTSLFTLECIINVILFGFLLNGKRSYLRDGWNVMDFLIVIFAIFSIAMDSFFAGSGVDFAYLKVFRLLRVLRPLRMLKRNQGLQIQVLSLMNAIPNISNLILIMVLVLMLFGI